MADKSSVLSQSCLNHPREYWKFMSMMLQALSELPHKSMCIVALVKIIEETVRFMVSKVRLKLLIYVVLFQKKKKKKKKEWLT